MSCVIILHIKIFLLACNYVKYTFVEFSWIARQNRILKISIRSTIIHYRDIKKQEIYSFLIKGIDFLFISMQKCISIFFFFHFFISSSFSSSSCLTNIFFFLICYMNELDEWNWLSQTDKTRQKLQKNKLKFKFFFNKINLPFIFNKNKHQSWLYMICIEPRDNLLIIIKKI